MNKVNMALNSFRLSAVQGSREARTELYEYVQRKSTGAANEVMHQELGQSLVLTAKAGPSGGGI